MPEPKPKSTEDQDQNQNQNQDQDTDKDDQTGRRKAGSDLAYPRPPSSPPPESKQALIELPLQLEHGWYARVHSDKETARILWNAWPLGVWKYARDLQVTRLRKDIDR